MHAIVLRGTVAQFHGGVPIHTDTTHEMVLRGDPGELQVRPPFDHNTVEPSAYREPGERDASYPIGRDRLGSPAVNNGAAVPINGYPVGHDRHRFLTRTADMNRLPGFRLL